MKLIIDVDDNDYELLNKTGIEIDWNTAWHGKEKDREMTFAIFDLVKALKNGKPYEERPQGKWVFLKANEKQTNGYERSVCKTTYHTRVPYFSEFNFCPNCGAKMQKGGAE